MQKRLTNHSNFAAKPIDNILFQSTKGNFLLPCNPDSHVVYPNTFVSDFLKFYPELFALPKSTWNYIVQFWYLDLSPTDSIIQECILSLPLNQDPFLPAVFKAESNFYHRLMPHAQGQSSLYHSQRFFFLWYPWNWDFLWFLFPYLARWQKHSFSQWSFP